MTKNEMLETLEYTKKLATILQKKLCGYGTTNGDGKPCDCKFFVFTDTIDEQISGKESMNAHGEKTGCCEARSIIRYLEEITKSIERKNNV